MIVFINYNAHKTDNIHLFGDKRYLEISFRHYLKHLLIFECSFILNTHPFLNIQSYVDIIIFQTQIYC